MIAPIHIDKLNEICVMTDGVKFGASVTLAEVEHTLLDVIDNYPGNNTEISKRGFVERLHR